MTQRVLLAVTHLLGAGHLTRTAAIARALARAGHEVTLVSGGRPTSLASTAGLDLVELPPVHALAGDFSTLRDDSDQPAGQDMLDRRRAILLETHERVRPDAVVTELFPFGRRSLAPEFLALIEAAHCRPDRPLVVSSIRDILATPSTGTKVRRTHELVERYFDAVLAHGDPNVIPLEASWPATPAIQDRLIYTGYVDADSADQEEDPHSATDGPITVSGGSSAAALPLYRAAIEAARLLPGRTWRILVGKGVPVQDVAELRREAGPNVALEPARADFRAILRGSSLFVGQAGYNTAIDLFRTQTRAILVPFEAGGETEQRLRADYLAAKGLAALLPEAELNGFRLAKLASERLASDPPAATTLDLGGAERSATLIEDLAQRRRSGSYPTGRRQRRASP